MARELTLTVTADTQGAEQNLARVEGAVQGIEKAAAPAADAVKQTDQALAGAATSAKGASEAFGALIARVGGPVGIATAFLEAGRRAMEYADRISDMSRRTGIGVEALQKFEVVAKMGGSSLDAVALAAQRLGERLASGDKSAVASITALGLNVQGLLRLSPEDRFLAWAEAIAKVEDPAKQAQFAMDGVGRSGLQLLGVLKDLGEGTAELAPAMGEGWIQVGGMMADAFDLIVAHAKNLVYYLGLVIPKSLADGINAWREAAQLMGFARPDNIPAAPGAPEGIFPEAAGALPLPEGWDKRDFIPRPRATAGRTGGRGGSATPAPITIPLLDQSDTNAWMLRARGPWQSGMLPFAGNPWQQFPGWAPIETTGWTPPMAPLASPVAMNAPGGSGPSFFQRMQSFFSNPIANFGLSSAMGLLPSFSGQGASLGGGLGSAFGSLKGVGNALGGFASFLGPIGGVVGGLLGKLFGPSEASKTQTERAGFLEKFGGFDELAKAADKANFSIEKLMNTKKVKDFEAEVKKLTQAIDQQASDEQRLSAAMDRYGFSIDQAGQKFKQMQMNRGALEFGEDARVLLQAGFSMEDISTRMGPALGQFVDESIRLGTQVPRELEGIIRKMIEMGTLVDANGVAITQLAQVPFAETMTQGFDRVVSALERLISTFDQAGGAAEAFASRAGSIRVDAPTTDLNTTLPIEEPILASRGGIVLGPGRIQYFSRGGMVWDSPFAWRSGIDVDLSRGTDTVPAMLTPGEMVLNREQQRQVFDRSGSVRGETSGDRVTVMAFPMLMAHSERQVEKHLTKNIGGGPTREAIQHIVRAEVRKMLRRAG